MADLALESIINTETLSQLGYQYFESEDKWGIGDFACDYIFINKMEINEMGMDTRSAEEGAPRRLNN